ncbi:MAG: leucine-rich repeat protein [Bacteroides sp.]|nr:leucine-rich repeat protein [Bacteroides sp.]
MKKFFRLAMLSLPFLMVTACQDDDLIDYNPSPNGNKAITLSGEIDQVAVTRVNDNGFADGDVMGVYIVDYNGSTPGTLQSSGNRGNNVRHTFDEANYKWTSAYDVYWKDKTTHIDVYGYYPFGSPTDVNNYELEVAKDQSKEATSEGMGGYEASDFLWGKAENVAPTDQVIRIPLRHRMSSAKITLVEGNGFADGEWAGLEKNVLVKNTKRKSIIDLATGEIKATGEVATTGIIPYKKDDYYRAIVVPQTIAAETPLFSITVNGIAYTFKKSEAFAYVSGKMHNFSIKVDKKTSTGDYTFTLVGESITAWENDDVSHDATMKEYIVINSTPGGLKDAITAAGKDYTQLQNLKITGEVNASDFFFMRDEMKLLQALNMKEMIIVGESPNIIPEDAFKNKTSLTHLLLPNKLEIIGRSAFAGCSNITGSLHIPEGVTEIMSEAFLDCRGMTGSLSLPTTLRIIGNNKGEGIGAFRGCTFVCELSLPDNLEVIGEQTFYGCNGFYGELRLPEKLKEIGKLSFDGCNNLSGSLVIPQGVKVISGSAFSGCGFNGTLTLHDGITALEGGAFNGCHFKGEIKLPKDLMVISDNVFYGCDFSGTLKLPEKIVTIGNKAFAYNWRLMGILEFPEGVETIGAGAFAHCRSIEGLIFPESLETICYEASYYEDGGAFEGCYGIGSIVCKGGIPAYVQPGAFNGVPKDNFTLEVPESAITLYQTEQGWMDFKRIAAHHELVCRPSIACAINTETTRRLVLNAEGDWEVESMPDWCSLSQTSGSSKTELTLTIHQMPAGSPIRTGEIIFKLKDKDYTHKCTVSQYDYMYAEDEIITKQTATKGNNGGINLVFLGDGFDAKDISEGKYMAAMEEQIENFFGIEPYKTYRDYFNVHTAIAVSPETGIGAVNTIRYAKFETTFTGGVGLRCDYDAVFDYALRIPEVTRENLDQTLIIMVPNSTDYGGICQMWESGAAIAFCPMSTYGYPLDTRGVIQHEAGGHGFGKLGDEYIYHNAFIDFCDCTCCGHAWELQVCFSLGWFQNLSLTGKMHEVPWSHLIFDDRYSDIVDIFEGGYMHARGVFRSEQNSCMNNDIPYYSTISREAIVKRIKAYAGEEYSFEEFVANDKRDAGASTRLYDLPTYTGRSIASSHSHPQIHKGSPLGK